MRWCLIFLLHDEDALSHAIDEVEILTDLVAKALLETGYVGDDAGHDRNQDADDCVDGQVSKNYRPNVLLEHHIA